MGVEIMSAALLELGEDRIASADQDTERARVVRDVYAAERDALLEEHPWNFAIRRAALARTDAVPAFGFARAFRLPADCLHVIETDPEAEYRIEGGCLLCDLDAVGARYVRRVENPAEMPPTFKAALAVRVAAKLAKKITGSSAEKERLEKLYADRLRTAKGRDARGGGSPEAHRPDLFERARR